LSRMRSLVTSRSNWAKERSTFRVSLTIEVEVLNCWVTDTEETPCCSKRSTMRTKSDSERLSRSLTAERKAKARELAAALGGEIEITVDVATGRKEYRAILDELVTRVSCQGQQIKSREGRLKKVVEGVLPIELARALTRDGTV
jgi:hypothetical protein